MTLAIYIVSAVAIIACIIAIILCRRYVMKAFNSIDSVLDSILAKDTYLLTETTGEDRISKITYKARRILDMSLAETERTNDEKATIQGFISDMSHQMKTPLSGISMYADLLLEGNISEEEQQEFLARIKNSAGKLQWMMDSLIKMSRLEVGAIQLTPALENIRRTISDAIESIIAVAAKKNINIAVSEFTDTALYHDKRWTREAIANVLENAVKYNYLRAKGWSKEATCAIIGNMEKESTINPGRYGSNGSNINILGLVQWSPKTKYTNWGTAGGYSFDSMKGQLERLLWEVENLGPTGADQWYATSSYNLTFKQFTTSTQTPEWLASAFLYCYERAGSGTESERRANTRKWYNTFA